jgi:hypothetical protein
VHAAYVMAELGRQQKAPELLIAAARVIGTTNSEMGKLPAKSKVGKLLDSNEVDEALELVKEAERIAEEKKNTATIQPLAAACKKLISGDRGPINGPVVWSGYFRGDGIDRLDTYYVTCYGGEWTCVNLYGYGPPGLDLDLYVFDNETGQQVAADASVGPNAYVQFFVPFAKTYRVEVRNFTANIPCKYYQLRASRP